MDDSIYIKLYCWLIYKQGIVQYVVYPMECPYCSHAHSKVTNKRRCPGGIRRRRECLKCKKRFTTHEMVHNEEIYVVKKDGRREKFSLEKLSGGIQRALEKRPIAQELIEKEINDLETQIRKKGLGEIKSSLIGEMVMKKLKKIDNVAYIRFASVYRNFKDINEFKSELKDL